MPFPYTEDKKGLSLPGIIDIIFLLLVFSLVRLSISLPGVPGEESDGKDTSLPYVREIIPAEIGTYISTLTLEINRQNPNDPNSQRIVYAIFPAPAHEEPLTLEEGRNRSIRDSLFAFFPINFLTMSEETFEGTAPCRLIRDAIANYKTHQFLRPLPSNTIDVRAARGTEFRIIRYILNQCAQYGDTIPNISIHVLSP